MASRDKLTAFQPPPLAAQNIGAVTAVGRTAAVARRRGWEVEGDFGEWAWLRENIAGAFSNAWQLPESGPSFTNVGWWLILCLVQQVPMLADCGANMEERQEIPHRWLGAQFSGRSLPPGTRPGATPVRLPGLRGIRRGDELLSVNGKCQFQLMCQEPGKGWAFGHPNVAPLKMENMQIKADKAEDEIGEWEIHPAIQQQNWW
eukprot:Skav235433  [mRNA]  locus=scaffold774:32986:37730:+ [translate_table: standard]